jgi:hypothetical protein
MSGNGRKKAAAKTESARSPESAVGDSPRPGKNPGVAKPADEGPEAEASRATERVRILQLLMNFSGQIYRAMTTWLGPGVVLRRVLAVITWLTLLGAFAGLVLVVLLNWQHWYMIAVVSGFTGASILGNRTRGRGSG